MYPKYHLITSLILSTVVLFITNNYYYSLTVLFFGVMLDLDHIIDYFILYNKKLDFKIIMCGMYNNKTKVYVFFHSYELLLLICLAAYLLGFPDYIFYIMLGFLSHITLDLIEYPLKFYYYFLSYRMIIKFRHDCKQWHCPKTDTLIY